MNYNFFLPANIVRLSTQCNLIPVDFSDIPPNIALGLNISYIIMVVVSCFFFLDLSMKAFLETPECAIIL